MAKQDKPVATDAETGIKAEFEVRRVEPGMDEEHVFLQAVRHPNASGELANESWGGNNPHGFVEILLKGGTLMGKLKAGGRVLIDITVL